jgi:glutamate-1-semialdehyde 2,1-aminomutase
MNSYAQSKELYERASQVLAGGIASEFRRFSTPYPLFYARAVGSRIWDVDGNEYLDFTLSQGPMILGHSHPAVLEAVANASQSGQLFAGQHLQELELAELLQKEIPCAELIRFSLSGSEADHAAIRVARAITGRPKFLRFEGHYHGWLDGMASGIAAPNLEALGSRENPNLIAWTQGLPPHALEETLLLPWNDLELLTKTVEAHADELAAIIMEPVMCNSGCIPPLPGFLEGARELCTKHGIALIFDEVITGFRLGSGGAQAWFGVTPDLAVFGKAMASGYPISVLAGKRDWMRPIAEGKVIHAGTMNSGNPSIAAALATVRTLLDQKIPSALSKKGTLLMQGLGKAGEVTGHALKVQGMGAMFHVGFTKQETINDLRDTFAYDKAKYAQFVAGMQERGVRLIGRGLWYVSAAHTPAEIDHAVSTATAVLKDIPVE